MSRTVLVTGATGFVAQQLIIDLLEQGHRVRGTVRDSGKTESLHAILRQHTDRGEELELVQANLDASQGWAEAAKGVDVVHHVASPFPLSFPKDPDHLIVPARDGCLRVLQAAEAEKVQRVVMTSSTAAISYGYPQLPEVLDEDNWTDHNYFADCPPYPASKVIAEKAAWEYVKAPDVDLELVTINPCGIYGPARSADVRASLSVIVQLMSGMPALPDMGMQIIDVRDVSTAHIAAMEHPAAAGERFAVSGEYLHMEEIGEILRARFPEYSDKIPSKKVPDFLIRMAALFNSDVKSARFELKKRRYVSGQKASDMLLGRPYISAENAIIASAESLIKYGAID